MSKVYQDILNFWFKELEPQQQFQSSDALDQEISQRFGEWVEKAKAGELYKWRQDLKGRLAEIILLDQFSRNIFRDTARAFESDDMALALAQAALHEPGWEELSPQEKHFMYMPFMHSESLYIHEELSLPLFSQEDMKENFKYAQAHYDQIKAFGRYPFRNEALNRPSTPEEIEFMKHNENF